jgi:hypothetical protein
MVQKLATSPQALTGIASYLFNTDKIESLKPEQKALLEKIKQDSASNAALTAERLAAARELMNTGVDPTVAYANSMEALNVRKAEAQRTAALGGRTSQQPFIQRAYDIAAVEKGAEAARGAAEERRRALAAGSSALAGVKYETSQPEQAALAIKSQTAGLESQNLSQLFGGLGAAFGGASKPNTGMGAARPTQTAQAQPSAGLNMSGYKPVSEDMFGNYAGA